MARDVAGAAALCGDPRIPERRADRTGLDCAIGLPAITTPRSACSAYSEDEMVAKLAASGFTASRAHFNIGHNP